LGERLGFNVQSQFSKKIDLNNLSIYSKSQIKNQMDPLHGITLKAILEKLVEFYGFDTLGELIKIKCFNENPTINSSLTFLRKTEWARVKVEQLYVRSLKKFEAK
jgi:uncharacterized protein (DUF2132 family)